MKSQLLCLFLILSITVSKSQVNFYLENAVWSVSTKKFFTNGDTILNANHYKKIMLANDSVINQDSAIFYAGIREDSTSRRVYAYLIGDTIEHLLYDFSLNVGDSITLKNQSAFFYRNISSDYNIKIYSIDTILINGLSHRRFIIRPIRAFGSYIPEFWIEGIGANIGLFERGLSDASLVDAGAPELLCFSLNGSVIYRQRNTCYFPILMGLNDTHSFEKQFSIFPNPAKDFAFIEQIERMNGMDKIRAMDALGRVYNIDFKLDANNKTRLNTSNLEDGFYILTFISKNETFKTTVVILK